MLAALEKVGRLLWAQLQVLIRWGQECFPQVLVSQQLGWTLPLGIAQHPLSTLQPPLPPAILIPQVPVTQVVTLVLPHHARSSSLPLRSAGPLLLLHPHYPSPRLPARAGLTVAR